MSVLPSLLQRMYGQIEEQKKNINSFYQSQQAALTDLYKTKYYGELMENTVKKIRFYLDQNPRLNPAQLQQNQNNIAAETAILRATQQEMNREIARFKQISNAQESLSGKMLKIKKEITRLLEKAEKVIAKQ